MKTLSIRIVSGRKNLPETIVTAGKKTSIKTFTVKTHTYLRLIFTMSPRVVSFLM